MKPDNHEHFFKDQRLPEIECRYSQRSNRVFKPHMHKRFSVGAVNEGEVQYQVNNEKAQLSPNSLAIINPETLHSCNCQDRGSRNYYMLYISVDYGLKIQQSLWQTEHFIPAATIQIKGSNLYQSYLAAMTCLMNPQEHLLRKEQLLAELLSAIFQICCNPGKVQPKSASQLEKFKQCLAKDLHSDLPLNELAKKLDANPFTLLRQFKHQTGITPHAYRMNCRIEQARMFLQQGKDITDTALLCGFFDQSHFHRHFKAMTTVTPKEYQRNFVQ